MEDNMRKTGIPCCTAETNTKMYINYSLIKIVYIYNIQLYTIYKRRKNQSRLHQQAQSEMKSAIIKGYQKKKPRMSPLSILGTRNK